LLGSSTGLVEAETIFNPIFCRLKGRLFRRNRRIGGADGESMRSRSEPGLSSLKIEMHDE
jgi:hypothetical protein